MKDPSTIIWIFIIIIFVVGPLIKKIMEGMAGTGPGQKSRQNIKEYLERMRREGRYKTHPKYQQKPQQRQQQYRAPATKPTAVPQKMDRQKFDRIDRQVQHDISEHVAKHIDSEVTKHMPEQISSKKGRVSRAPKAPGEETTKQPIQALQERVMNNPGYTDVQKAIVLAEIFDRPKAQKKG